MTIPVSGNIIFLHGNTSALKGSLSVEKLTDLKYDFFEQTFFTPNLTPSDRHLFLNPKKFLFGSIEKALVPVNDYFADPSRMKSIY